MLSEERKEPAVGYQVFLAHNTFGYVLREKARVLVSDPDGGYSVLEPCKSSNPQATSKHLETCFEVLVEALEAGAFVRVFVCCLYVVAVYMLCAAEGLRVRGARCEC